MGDFERTFGAGADAASIIYRDSSQREESSFEYEIFDSYEEACEWSKSNNGAPFFPEGEYYLAIVKKQKPFIKPPIYDNCDRYQIDTEQLSKNENNYIDLSEMIRFISMCYGSADCRALKLEISHLLGLETALLKNGFGIVPYSNEQYIICDTVANYPILAFLVFKNGEYNIISDPDTTNTLAFIITRNRYF